VIRFKCYSLCLCYLLLVYYILSLEMPIILWSGKRNQNPKVIEYQNCKISGSQEHRRFSLQQSILCLSIIINGFILSVRLKIMKLKENWDPRKLLCVLINFAISCGPPHGDLALLRILIICLSACLEKAIIKRHLTITTYMNTNLSSETTSS